jgi:hypothetical protein
MYIVPEVRPKVYLIHRDGTKWEFKNLEEAANELRRLGYYNPRNSFMSTPVVGDHFKIHRSDYMYDDEVIGSIIYYDYIVRDEYGRVITVNDLKDSVSPTSRWRKKRLSEIEFCKKHFRGIPIPYTGRRGYSSCYRHIYTTQEHRENDFLRYDEDAQEYNIKPRARRTMKNLPNAWDDIARSDWDAKNWKHRRKTQWKEKNKALKKY